MVYFSTLLISLFSTIALMPFFRKMAFRLNALDVPDERKVHPFPIPKCGGVAMAVGVIIPVIVWAPKNSFLAAVLIGAGIITVFGVIDDFTELGYKSKLFGQIMASLVVILYGGIKIKSLGMLLPDNMLLPEWLSIILTLVVFIGVTNAINLADGLDGLAGGVCLLIFICLSYLGYRADNICATLLAIAVVGAIFGFLRFNTHPATLFMGDAGSQLLGFLAITLSLALTQRGDTPYSTLLPLIFLGFPVLDTLTVMIERISKGHSPFVADKNHFHHKLLRLGLFQTEAVFSIYVIQGFMVSFAFIFRFYSEWLLLGFYLIFSGITILAFSWADRQQWQLKRNGFDRSVKGPLKLVKDKNIPIKVSFRIISYGVPFLLILSCLFCEAVPFHVSISAFFFIVFFFVISLLKKEWTNTAMEIILYLTIPFAVFWSEKGLSCCVSDGLAYVYNISFGVLAFFVFMTLKLTRRKKGFEITTMHFLVLFVALVVPNLPDPWIKSQHLGLMAAKIIVLFFGFEVLIGELRGKTKKVWFLVLLSIVILGLKGIY